MTGTYIIDYYNYTLYVPNASLHNLPDPRAIKAIILRYGFDGYREHTFKEIASLIFTIRDPSKNISLERARQLLSKGIRLLRNPKRGCIVIDHASNKLYSDAHIV